MKTIILILSIIGVGCTQNQVRHVGLEIFEVKYRDSDVHKGRTMGCSHCLNLNENVLSKHPLLTETDIENFDWEKQRIELTPEAKIRIKNLEIPLEWRPMAMMLNGEIVYGFWFWNIVSSFSCDRVYAYSNNGFQLKFGLPDSNTHGSDPRFDSKLKKYLDGKKGKLSGNKSVR